MDFEIVNGDVTALETECLVIGIGADATLSPSAQAIDKATDGDIKNLLDAGDITGKAAQTLLLQRLPGVTAKRTLLVGLGKEDERSDSSHRKLLKAIMATAKGLNLKNLTIALDGLASDQADTYRQIRHQAEWATAELYQYDETKSTKADPLAIEQIAFHLSDADTEEGEGALVDAAAIANGVNLARDLGNLPGNICTPVYLAEQAMELAREYESLTCEVLDEDALRQLGLHSLLSVGHGSEQPSRLIVLQHTGTDTDSKPHVLVGKGITFDTGGISLKPGAKMDEMKFDMCGAASVMGTLQAAADMALPINLVGVIAAAENMPSGRATKPGDVITTLSGQTVEVLNTDAEGRLVLCDALSYIERFKPASVIDIATLTGACIVALGHVVSGMLANDDDLANELILAGDYAADRVWRLPLWDDYQELLDSNFADIANIGGPSAGTITAACFLSRFTKDYRWAHIDIAGTAWNSAGKEKGATGRCVSLLSQYLLNQAAEELTDDA